MIQIEGSDRVGLASFVLEALTLEVKPRRYPLKTAKVLF
jgi:hypothetical protein